MICPYCGKPARWVDNKVVYGKRFGKSFMMRWCEPCDARGGCHQNTQKPLGTMADAHLRGARAGMHELFDPLWKSGLMTRNEAYRRLHEAAGYEVHFGETTLESCAKLVTIIQQEFKWELSMGPIDPNSKE